MNAALSPVRADRGQLARVAWLGLVIASAVHAADPKPVTETFGFSLIPNAFARNPQLSMTMFTEMTPFGRTLRPATPDAPVYFEAFDRGRMSMGEVVGESIFPTPEALRENLITALAVNGYQPAPAGQPASLVLIYYWGSHSRMDLEEAQMFPERNIQQMLERAMLVGGSRYRQDLARQYSFGSTIADRTPKKMFLWDQASQDLYFVVVSAYDHAELAAGHRRLAWRTTMTVNANGVSMRDAVPPLVISAGEYLGRETLDTVAIGRRVRRGTVSLGPLTVITDGDEKSAPKH